MFIRSGLLLLLPLVACGEIPGTVVHAHRGGPRGSHVGADSADTGEAADTAEDSGDPVDTGPTTLVGIDVSGWDPGIDWSKVAASGVYFSYAKATEGTYYTNDEFPAQNAGAAAVGLLRGAYHFANPSYSGAIEQADFFVDNGGAWLDDGKTLPGVLDFEWNPYDGGDCYAMTPHELGSWVRDFAEEYQARVGRLPVIYTSKTYWGECVDSAAGSGLPLWVSDWGSGAPELPTGWLEWTFWQTAADGTVPGVDGEVDLNQFGDNLTALRTFAMGE